MKAERILVVDDDPALLRAVERVLGPHYETTGAASGDEALERARTFVPDLAILDVHMPGMDGFALLGRLRDADPGLDAIFMTGVVHELDAQLVRSIRERAFYFIHKPFERELLLALVERCLEQRRLQSENRGHLARLEEELAAARSFQQSLLPASVARAGSLAIACRYEPCSELGGDFVDHAAHAGRVALLIADVSGHGVSAAMLTAVVKSAFQAARAEGFAPLHVVQRVAAGVRSFDDSRFVTLFSALLQPADGALEYVNAGHPPALILPAAGADGARSLPRTGPLVSPAFPDGGWEAGRTRLAPGERLLLFTDGVLEARGPGGLFGEARLRELLRAAQGSGPRLLEEIVAGVSAFAAGRPLDDDLTLLTATREADPGP